MLRALTIFTLLAVALSGTAWADTLTFNLGNTFSGDQPVDNVAWLGATFTGLADGTVSLEMEVLHFVPNEFVTEWDFNLNPGYNPASLVITHQSGATAASVGKAADNFKADGDGKYDISFGFPTSGARFTGGNSIYLFSLPGVTLTAADFNYLSLPAGGHGPFHTAAHVQAIPRADSGWISEGGFLPPEEVPTPEPDSLVLTGIGVSLFVAAGWCRRRFVASHN